jgi:hypothetical protein
MFNKVKDTQFVVTFQLALIGIVLIGSLFLIWKAISRVEEKVDMLLFEKKAGDFTFNFAQQEPLPVAMEETEGAADEEPFKVPDGEDHTVTIEDITNFEEDNTLSRTKLRQMNLDKIKAICEEKGISSEGTKNQLIDKLLQVERV